MTQPSSPPTDLLLEEYLALQAQLEARGDVPAGSGRVLRILAAIQLAFLVACVSLFLNFLVVNMIFHVGS